MAKQELVRLVLFISTAWIAVMMVAPIIFIGLYVWWNFVFQTARGMGL